MNRGRLILFSGMGGDHRLLRLLRVTGTELVTPDFVDPPPGCTLPQYARLMADRTDIRSDDIVGGASFGGMVAAEISRHQPVAGVILLGSCLHPSRLPWFCRPVERSSRLAPAFIFKLRSWPPLVRFRFAPLTPDALQSMIAMAADCPSRRLRDFGRMIVTWSGTDVTCPLLSIHGDRDRILPLRVAEPGLVLRNAGHAFTLTHPEPISRAIQDFVTRIRHPAPQSHA